MSDNDVQNSVAPVPGAKQVVLPGMDVTADPIPTGRSVNENTGTDSQAAGISAPPSSPAVGSPSEAIQSNPTDHLVNSAYQDRDPVERFYTAKEADEHNSRVDDFINSTPKDEQEKPSPDLLPKSDFQKTAQALGFGPEHWEGLAKPGTLAGYVTSGEYAKDMAGKVSGYATQSAAGIGDLVQDTWNTANKLSAWGNKTLSALAGLGFDRPDIDDSAKRITSISDSFPEPKTWDEAMLRGVVHYTAGMALWSNSLTAPMAMGATQALSFDPHQENFSNLIAKHAPSLALPFLAYTMSQPGDSDAKAMVKQFIDGVGFGAITEGLGYALDLQRNQTFTRGIRQGMVRLTTEEHGSVPGPPKEGGTPPPPTAEMRGEGVTPTSANEAISKQEMQEAADNAAANPIKSLPEMATPPIKITAKSSLWDHLNAQLSNEGPNRLADVLADQTKTNPETAGRLKLNQLNLAPEAKELLSKLSKFSEESLQNYKRGETVDYGEEYGVRNNVITDKQARINAEEQSKMTLKKAMNIPAGTVLNQEDLMKMKEYVEGVSALAERAQAKVLQGGSTQAEQLQFVELAQISNVLSGSLESVISEGARSLRANQIKLGVKDAESMRRIADELLESRLGPLQAEELAKLRETITLHKDGNSVYGYSMGENRIGRLADTIGDIVKSMMVNKLHLVEAKALGDAIKVGSNEAEALVAASMNLPLRLYSKIMKGESKGVAAMGDRAWAPDIGVTFGGRANAALARIDGFMDTLKAAWLGFKGEPMKLAMKATTDDILGYKRKPPELEGPMDKALDVIGQYGLAPHSIGPRMMNAVNQAVQFSEVRSYLGELGYNKAEALGLTGPARKAMKEATMANPNKDEIQAAIRQAKYVTNTQDLSGQFKAFEKVQKAPVISMFVPFFKWMANAMDAGLERSILFPGSPHFWSEVAGENANIASRQMAAARLGIYALPQMVFLKMYIDGQLSGSVPANPTAKAVKDASKQDPYSVRFNDEWVDLNKLGTIGNVGKIVADMGDTFFHREMSGDPKHEEFFNGGLRIAAELTPTEMIKRVGTLLDAVGEKDPHKMANLLADLATMPLSGELSSIRRLYDPNKYDTRPYPMTGDSLAKSVMDGIKNKMSADIPLWKANVPLWHNITGEAVVAPQGYGPDNISPLYMSKARDSVGAKKMQELSMLDRDGYNANQDPAYEPFRIGYPSRFIQKPIKQSQSGVPNISLSMNLGMKSQPQYTGEKLISEPLNGFEYQRFVQLAAGDELRASGGVKWIDAVDSYVKSGFTEDKPWCHNLGKTAENPDDQRIALSALRKWFVDRAREQLLNESEQRTIEGAPDMSIRQRLQEKVRQKREILNSPNGQLRMAP